MEVIEKILKNDLVISLREGIKILGNDKAIYRLVDKGDLQKVHPGGLGFFSLPNVSNTTAQFAIVRKHYSQCVISGRTALSLYDLGQDYIDKIDVDIPNSMNLLNELLNVHRIVSSKITNVVNRKFENKGVVLPVNIYSPERVLFEGYKYFKGLDSYFYCLKQYKSLYLNLESPGDQFNSILKINKRIGREIVDLLIMEG